MAVDASATPAKTNPFFDKDSPSRMRVLSFLLVFMLHVWGGMLLLQPQQPLTEAKPLVMEVSMLSIAAPKPSVTPPPPQPAPPPPPPEKKPLPKKPEPKPVPKKLPPIVQKSPEATPSEPVAEPTPAPQIAPSTASSSASNTPAPPAPPAPAPDTFTEANFKANYAHNPKPDYPAIAKSRGWQGKVFLRVQVSVDGSAENVVVDRSSGHDMLDESAIEAVKKWRFIPAKRGETPVASSVIVPIIFTLRD
jgi:protein TonB